MAYIYKIINDINQKIYIGKTEFSIEKRFKEHCADAFRDRNEKRPLYAAMCKYGIEHFHIEQIEETNNPEERESYWIEYFRSFKNGYNATIGGNGKKYIDYDLVISTYKELGYVDQVAKKLNISVDQTSKILHQNNIQVLSGQEAIQKRYGKITNMYDLSDNFLCSFPSTHKAVKYMIENHLTNCKHSTIKQHIHEVCIGKRKTAAKFKWKYDE